jgi:hypothetical protein
MHRDEFYNRLPENLEYYAYSKEFSKEFLEPIKATLGVKVYLPNYPPLRIMECPRNSFYSRYPAIAGCRGAYDSKDNIIWLPYNMWCRKTLIHEVLHAVSHFAYGRQTEFGKIKLFNEGLAEFFTGWVLHNYYEHCYNVWINDGFFDPCNDCDYLDSSKCRFCGLSYKRKLKIIWILIENVDVNDVIELFVWKPNSNWKDIYDNFIKRYGIEDVFFKNGKLHYTDFIDDEFLNAMIDAFELDEEDVDDILNSDIKEVIDYSKL